MGAETNSCIALSSERSATGVVILRRVPLQSRGHAERETGRNPPRRNSSREKVQQLLIEGFGGFDVGEMGCG
jgi:hypothetical protein